MTTPAKAAPATVTTPAKPNAPAHVHGADKPAVELVTELSAHNGVERKVLDRAFFITNSQRPIEPDLLYVPEWEASVYVRRVYSGGLDAYQDDLGKFPAEVRAVALAHALCDKDGAPLFDVTRPSDRAYLSRQDAKGAERVVDHFLVLNGLRRGN